MKKILSFAASLLLVAGSLASCGKESNEDTYATFGNSPDTALICLNN